MTLEDHKDVTIGEHTYRVGRMLATTGSWIVAQIVTKILPFGMDEKVTGNSDLPKERSEMTEAEFRNIQNHCLAVIGRYETVGNIPTAIPILVRGEIIHDLRTDVVGVLQLTVHALIFNLSPFFNEDVLKQLTSGLPDLSLFNASK